MMTSQIQPHYFLAAIYLIGISIFGSIFVSALLQLTHWLAYCNDIRVCQWILQGFDFFLGPLAAYVRGHLTLPGIDLLRQLYLAGTCH